MIITYIIDHKGQHYSRFLFNHHNRNCSSDNRVARSNCFCSLYTFCNHRMIKYDIKCYIYLC